VAAITLAGTARAQGSQAAPHDHGRMGAMAHCQKMMAGATAGQQKLDELIAKMNAATGQLKIDQIAAVLTELVAQQRMIQTHIRCMGVPASTANAPKGPPQAGREQNQ
jgi:hypothetical protein